MKQNTIKRTLVESVVDQGLHSIRDDPKRSVRKLVDLGEDLAAGQFQKNFFLIAQRMLQNDDSPYYEMMRSAVDTISNDKLRTFGINFGWGCLTEGAAQIKLLEAHNDHNIPWSLTLHIGSGKHDMDGKEFLRLVDEGRQLGILAYFLWMDGSEQAYHVAMDIVSSANDCVFFLFMPKEFNVERYLPRLALPSNLMLCVDSRGKDWQTAALSLRSAGCLYALYRGYSSEQEVEEIISGNWMTQVLPYAGIATVCVAEYGCPPDAVQRVYQYVKDSRIGQWYPTLLTDCLSDNLYTDLCISGGPCFLGVLPDGYTTGYCCGKEVPLNVSVKELSLVEILVRYPSEET